MTDYKYLYRKNRLLDGVSWLIPGIIFAGLIGLMMGSCVDGVVREAERQEEHEPPPVYVQQTYTRPAAYRLASPTMAEMEHLHGMLRVMEVRR